jgi:hypothetical protein
VTPWQPRLIPDHVLDRLAFSGTPKQAVRQVEALSPRARGASKLGTPHGLTDRDSVELLAAGVAPAFRV